MKTEQEIVSFSPEDLCFTPATVLRQMIRNKLISPVELVNTFLQRIEAINHTINAYCTLIPERALESAKNAESAIMKGREIGLLHGIPASIKDVTMMAGVRTTFGSKYYENFVPDIDDLVVERLSKAGAVILGKTNTPEFAAGASTFNEIFGITRNPWNTEFSVGGSSGGAAAAVAAGISPLAQGSDLGGSCRIPASFCGVVGLRPSPGRIPCYPNRLNHDDLSVQGLIARTVPDIALMLQAVSGPDRRSPVCLPNENLEFLEPVWNPNIKGFKIAWGGNLNLVPVAGEVLKITKSSVEAFRELGCEVAEEAPDFSGVRDVAIILRGLRFVALYQDLFDAPRFKKLVNPLVIENIQQGLGLSVRKIAKAQQERSKIWDRVTKFFEEYDLLLTPTVPLPPFTAETRFPTEIDGEPMQSYVDWIMLTYAFSVVGFPAISVPCGWTHEGLPVGLQIVARYRSEVSLLRAAAAFELARPWGNKRPLIR